MTLIHTLPDWLIIAGIALVGLSENENIMSRIIDFDKGGLESDPLDIEAFKEIYEMMIQKNDRYASMYEDLKRNLDKATKPVIITEGQTDWMHIQNAMQRLNRDSLDVEFYKHDGPFGDSELEKMLLSFKRLKNEKKIIGIFDRDNLSNINVTKIDQEEYVDLGNNVYAFAIPSVNQDVYGDKISIEHYYQKDDLLKKDENGRRLFLGSEFYNSGMSIDGSYHTRCSKVQNKVNNNGVIDEKVYDYIKDREEVESLAMSKSNFAQLICEDESFSKDVDFSSFEQIISILEKICAL